MDQHKRVIIHIDIDYFFAQVEELKNPKLKEVALAIQQKHILVTCNYIARSKGITKLMPIYKAKEICPELVLVNGEDLHDYRYYSNKIHELLKSYDCPVEKFALDENFIDVTKLVQKQSSCLIGNIYGSEQDDCGCGCFEMLKAGSKIASEMRERIKNEIGLTTCAGISHNKLLAKLVGAKNKPNQQTTVFPSSGYELIQSLGSLKKIPGFGNATVNKLREIGIETVSQMQDADKSKLDLLFGDSKAKLLLDLSYGIDESEVRSSERCKTLGVEESCKLKSANLGEIKAQFSKLIGRLLILLGEDGRIPNLLRITIRKCSEINLSLGEKESKQTGINCKTINETILLEQCLKLYKDIVKKENCFVTLVGICLGNLKDKPKQNIENFFGKESKKRKAEEAILPSEIDKTVFNQLPEEIQKEILNQYKIPQTKPTKKQKTSSILNYFSKQ